MINNKHSFFMKKIIYSILLVASIFGVASCTNVSTEDDSIITYYFSFKMLGASTILVPVGTSFTDPGVTATEKGVDVTNEIVVGGDEVDPNVVGLYKITYSGTNVDGFTTSVTRTVIVCDPTVTTDMSGNYTTADGTHRIRSGVRVDFSGYPIVVAKIAPGFFSISDFFGGYYFPRLKDSDLTVDYTAIGYVQLNSDNSLTLLTSSVKAWGDALDGLENGVYDPDAETLYWEAKYAGDMSFNVFLTK